MLRLLRPHCTRGALGTAFAGLVLAVLAACSESPTAPRLQPPPDAKTGRMVVYADVGRSAAAIDGIVIAVSGPGIVKADGATPDTLVFNLAVVSGVASGSIEIPAGAGRSVTAHAFDGITETHRGTRTGVNVIEGINPTLSLTLLPLVGSQPITLSFGTTLVTVTPNDFSLLVGDTTRLRAEVRDQNNTVLVGARVRWATLNPGRASVDTLGLVTVLDTGEVQIVGTYGTVGGSAKARGIARASGPAPSYALIWNGSVSRDWFVANNWTPGVLGVARVPALTDSVVIPATATNQPRLEGCVTGAAVRDLIVEAGARLETVCGPGYGPSAGYGINVHGAVVGGGAVVVDLYARHGAHVRGGLANLWVTGGSVTLDSATTASYVEVQGTSGNLALAGHKLTTTGAGASYAMYVHSGGTVTLAAGDTLLALHDIYWTGGAQAGKLDGGVLQFRGTNFHAQQYKAGGTNKLLLDRATTAPQNLYGLDFVSDFSRASLQRLEVANGGGLGVCGHVSVADTFAIRTPVAVTQPCGGYYVRAQGPIATVVGSAVTSYLWQLVHATGNSLVLGTWSPTYTEVRAPGVRLLPSHAYQHLDVYASTVLEGDLSTLGRVMVHGTGTELSIGARRLVVGEHLQLDVGGLLGMQDAAGRVEVAQYAAFNWDGSAAQKSRLTAGVLQVGGYFYGLGFNASGTHRTLLTGTRSDSRYISGMEFVSARPDQAFQELEVSGGTYDVCGHARVRGTATVRAGATLREGGCGGYYLRVDGDLVTEAGSTLSPYLIAMYNASGTSNVNGLFAPLHADFDADAQPVKPGLDYRRLRFFAGAHRLSGPTVATIGVWVQGAGVELDLNGFRLDALGTTAAHSEPGLVLRAGGALAMRSANDTLTALYMDVNSAGALRDRLTAGAIKIGGDLHGQSYASSGAHTTVFTGTRQRLYNMNFVSVPSQQLANVLVQADTLDLCSHLDVVGTFELKPSDRVANPMIWSCGGPTSSDYYLQVRGDVRASAGSRLQNYRVYLSNPTGTTNVAAGATFAPQVTHVNFPYTGTQLKPGLGYLSMAFDKSVTLSQRMVVNGDLSVNGTGTQLVLNGQTLHVSGVLDLNTNGTVSMTNPADSLIVEGSVFWDGGATHAGKLTAGTLVARGARFYSAQYDGTGTNTVVFDRAAGTVSYEGVNAGVPSNSPLNQVIVRGGGLSLACNLHARGTVTVDAGANVVASCGGAQLAPEGGIATHAAASLQASGLGGHYMNLWLTHPSGTQNITGNYAVEGTYFHAPNAFIKPTLDYKYVQISRTTAFQDSTEIDGQLDVVGDAILDLAGNTVVVKSTLNFNESAKLRMNSPLDTMIVALGDPAADIFWDGGNNATGTGPTDSLLTNGAVKYYGDRFYGLHYKARPFSPHRLVFLATPGATGTVSVEGAPEMNVWAIEGARAVNVSCRVFIADTLRIATAALSGCEWIHLGDGGGGLVTGPTSSVTIRDVYLDDATGTRDVQGNFAPTNTYFRARTPAVTGAVKPTLGYRNAFFTSYQGTGVGTGARYALSGRTRFEGTLDVNTSETVLDLNGHTAEATSDFHVHAAAAIEMNQPTDSLVTGGSWRFGGAASTASAFSDGTISVGGTFLTFDRAETVDGTEIVMNGTTGTGQQDLWLDPAGFATTPITDLKFRGARGVRFTRGAQINGTFMDSSTGPVTAGSHVEFRGPTRSIAGSSLAFGDVSFNGANGSNELLGTFSSSGTATYAQTGSIIRVRPGATHNSITVAAAGITVNGDSLGMNGNLILTSGTSFTVPARSRIGGIAQATNGGLTFAGDARVANYIQALGSATVTIDAGAVRTGQIHFAITPQTVCTNNGSLFVAAPNPGNGYPAGHPATKICSPNEVVLDTPLTP